MMTNSDLTGFQPRRAGRFVVRGRAVALVACAMLAAMPAAAAPAPTPSPSASPSATAAPTDGVVDAPRAAALALRIRAILERAGSGGSVAYLTSRLQAEVGAAGVNCGTAKSALGQVSRKGLTPAAVAALDGLAGSADLCTGTGTGAITRGQALGQPTTLGLPGGSSNYQ